MSTHDPRPAAPQPDSPLQAALPFRDLTDCVDLVDAEAAADSADSVEPLEQAERARPVVEIRASTRRRSTVTAYREDDKVIVLVPARMSQRERERYAAELVERLEQREQRAARRRPSDAQLERRAAELSAQWFGSRARPDSVRWVGNQRSRWGSCTPVDRTIRLSDRMRDMPQYVIDSVLLHELAHLLEPNHSPAFWALLAPIPDQERAKAYLEGVSFGQHHLRD